MLLFKEREACNGGTDMGFYSGVYNAACITSLSKCYISNTTYLPDVIDNIFCLSFTSEILFDDISERDKNEIVHW